MDFSTMMKDLLAFPRQDPEVLKGCTSHWVVKENSSPEDNSVGDYPKQLAKGLCAPQPSPICQENAADMEGLVAQRDQQLKVRPNPPSGPTIHIPLGVNVAAGAASARGRGRGKRNQPSSTANSSGQGKVSYGSCGHLIQVLEAVLLTSHKKCTTKSISHFYQHFLPSE